MRHLTSREVAFTGTFAALVCASTLAFQIGIPATNGYFNVGEIMVYVSALLLGPGLGAVAGGIGSALSDAVSGFATTYAPGTLIIKGLEALIVSYVALHRPANLTPRMFRGIASLSASMIGFFLVALGSIYYSGAQQVTFFAQGLNITLPGFSFSTASPTYFQTTISYGVVVWIMLGIAAALFLLLVTIRLGPSNGWPAIAILIGGTEMVFGYLLYEAFVLQYGAAAIVEVPANIGQMVIGLIIGLPLARRIKLAFPRLNRATI